MGESSSFLVSAYEWRADIISRCSEDYWYASKTAEMPLSCQARLAAIKSAKKHKTGLAGEYRPSSLTKYHYSILCLAPIGVVSALLSMLYLRYKLQARVQEKQRVAELVQTALVQLQRQVSLRRFVNFLSMLTTDLLSSGASSSFRSRPRPLCSHRSFPTPRPRSSARSLPFSPSSTLETRRESRRRELERTSYGS